MVTKFPPLKKSVVKYLSPKAIVAKCKTVRTSWFYLLSDCDKRYVMEVAKEISKAGKNVSIYNVADVLKDELDLVVHRDNIARKLKELVKCRELKI